MMRMSQFSWARRARRRRQRRQQRPRHRDANLFLAASRLARWNPAGLARLRELACTRAQSEDARAVVVSVLPLLLLLLRLLLLHKIVVAPSY